MTSELQEDVKETNQGMSIWEGQGATLEDTERLDGEYLELKTALVQFLVDHKVGQVESQLAAMKGFIDGIAADSVEIKNKLCTRADSFTSQGQYIQEHVGL